MIMMAANLVVVVNMQRFDHLRIPKEQQMNQNQYVQFVLFKHQFRAINLVYERKETIIVLSIGSVSLLLVKIPKKSFPFFVVVPGWLV